MPRPNVAHVGKVNSNRVFCFFSPLFLFCIKCPPCRAVLPAWLKKKGCHGACTNNGNSNSSGHG